MTLDPHFYPRPSDSEMTKFTQMDDEVRLGADHYLMRMAERRGVIDNFLTGIRVACIAVALVLQSKQEEDQS